MQSISLRANAKLNLFLKINGIVNNSYHDMTMINQSVSLYDDITVTKNANKGIRIIDNSTNIKKEDNIIYKTAKIINDEIKNIDVDIKINKNIPIEAGLGGGSSDAATTILAINKIYELNLSNKQMIDIAVKIGADVPFCLFGGSKCVEGIGEKLSDINSDKFLFIIIKPYESMSTKKAFNLYDESNPTSKEINFLDEIKNKSQKIDLSFIKNNFYNDFEKIIIKEFPIIKYIKEEFYNFGAEFSMMSGSGTTVYAIYKDECTRLKAYDRLKLKYSNIYLAQTVYSY